MRKPLLLACALAALPAEAGRRYTVRDEGSAPRSVTVNVQIR